MYDFSLDRYSVFIAAAETGSFTSAAKQLHMTQSAVSQSVLKLESQLRTDVFVRSAKGIKLSVSGKELYRYIKQAMVLIETGQQRIDDINNLQFGTLRIGTGDALCRHILIEPLKEFSNKYPDIKIELTNSTSHNSVNLLRDGKVDFAIAHTYNVYDKALNYHHLQQLSLVAVAQDIYPIDSSSFTKADLVSHPIILLDDTTTTRKLIDGYFSDNDLDITPEFSTGSTDTMIDLARAGLGIAIVTKEFVDRWDGLKVLKGIDDLPTRKASLITGKNTALSKAAQRFFDIIKNQSEQT